MVSGVVTRSPAVDLRAAAVYDHRAQSRVPQKHDVLRERDSE